MKMLSMQVKIKKWKRLRCHIKVHIGDNSPADRPVGWGWTYYQDSKLYTDRNSSHNDYKQRHTGMQFTRNIYPGPVTHVMWSSH